MDQFIKELEELCNKHNVGILWALNCIRIVSTVDPENSGKEPEKMKALARMKTLIKGNSTRFQILRE
jgi:hypothetical protein